MAAPLAFVDRVANRAIISGVSRAPTAAVVAILVFTAPAIAGDSSSPPSDSNPSPSDFDFEIIDKPISFGEQRVELTLEYRRVHQDPSADSVEIDPKMIVLHYTAGHSATGTWKYFNNERMSGERAKLRKAGALNVSAHFLVDRDGTVYRLVPETWMARHAIGVNHIAIGVENVGDGDRWPLTDAQVAANIALVRYLVAKHDITHLIGHSETGELDGTELFVELDSGYRNSKPDPGREFMQKVRDGVADLELQGVPEKNK